MLSPIVFKGLFYFAVYTLARIVKLYSLLDKLFSDRLVLMIIPFRYLFTCRFSECYVVISAFSRRYYDIVRVRKGETVVDIGAHIGTFTIRAAKKVGNKGRVIALEPEPSAWRILITNIQLNRLSNIFTLNCACDIKSGIVKLFIHEYTGSSIVFPSNKFIEAKAINLDGLVKLLKLSKIDYLKINAEGAELRILKGMSQWWKVQKVIVAAHHYDNEASEISQFLRKLGFKVQVVRLKGNTLVYAIR